jgi:hypothetical protein
MPTVTVRLSEKEERELRDLSAKQGMKVSDVIRWGIFYFRMAKDKDVEQDLSAVKDLLLDSVRGVLKGMELEAAKKLESQEYQERLKESIPEITSRLSIFTRRIEETKPYQKKRGRPPRLKGTRGRPVS